MKTDIDHLVARFAAEPVREVSDGARELMREITESEPAPAAPRARGWLTWRLAVPVTGALTAAVLGLTWILPSGSGLGPASAAALEIDREDGYYVIEINDLYADPERYQAQLRAAGLDITLRVLPVSQAFEGQVFPTTPGNQYVEDIKGIYPPGACDRLDGCAIGVKIPDSFDGTADISVGRKANPGEQYQSITSFDAKGEPMHCVPYFNKTVTEVRATLAERGVSIAEFAVDDLEAGEAVTKPSVPESWRVHGGYLTEPGKATVMAGPEELPEDNPDRGCPTG
ncbi:hypothetical protein [Nonomuraea africana]|uniref:hypothetical protein n=1 Tax=Nonomuraea africana TaxID=46171 RepID=UPI0033F830BA